MLEIKKLNKTFKNDKGIYDINISINKNDIIAILGPNGAGKSTLIKSIFGELKLDSGEITYNKENISKHYNKISFFTDQSLFPKELTLEYFCMYSAELAGINKKEAQKRTEHLLKILDLMEYKNKRFKSLSAGMQKRGMLAVSLIIDPEILFLDEPTANLDIESRKAFISLLKEMSLKNKSIIITSHIIDELQSLVNRVIILNEGKILLDKPFDNSQENLEKIYFSYIQDNKVKDYKNLTQWET